MLSEEMIHDLIEGLQLIFEKNITQIILYGSVARQEESAESDIDIAVVVEKMQNPEIRKKFIEWNAEMDMKYNRIFSIIDIEKSNMDQWRDVLTALREKGRVQIFTNLINADAKLLNDNGFSLSDRAEVIPVALFVDIANMLSNS